MQERCALVTVLLQTSPVFPVKVIRRTLSRLHLDIRGKFFAELSVSCLICLSVGAVSKIGMFSKIMVWNDLFLFFFLSNGILFTNPHGMFPQAHYYFSSHKVFLFSVALRK